MADRRMFHIKIVGSDAFLSLAPKAQALYFQICMRADEDGFVNAASQIAASVKATRRDLRQLIDKRFLLDFGGIVVVKHWKLANTQKNDRMKNCQYPDIAAKLWVRENGIYTDHPVAERPTLLEHKAACLAAKTAARDSKRNSVGIHPESSWNPSLAEQSLAEQSLAEQSTAHGPMGASAEDGFPEFWGRYPRKANEAEARQAWKAVTKYREEIMNGLDRWLSSEAWAEQGGRYIPKASVFLAEGRWRNPPVGDGGAIAQLQAARISMGTAGLGELERQAIARMLREQEQEEGGSV